MKILALDATMAACSAAVIDTQGPRILAEAFVAMERGHAEALPPMVGDVMNRAGLDFQAIDRIAVTTGPGSFTGVRIGLAFARGLGTALAVPVIGIDSLSAIAANEEAERSLLVVADARNAEVYAARFDGRRNLLDAPRVAAAASAAAELPAGTMVLGSAAQAVMKASGRTDLLLSSAMALPVAARFGMLAANAEPGAMPGPLYLRAPDARPQASPMRKIFALDIVAAGPECSHLLSAMHGEIFEDGWSAEAFAAMLATSGTSAMMAFEGEEPLGFLVTRSAADEAEVITIGTRPAAQRRGVARQMLERELPHLAATGVRNVFLEVAASNNAAQHLYRGLGFSEAGRRKGYYKQPGGAEDAIVMRRDLMP